MTIGEIKAEAMRLMNVELEGRNIALLEQDENVRDLYDRLVGAFNRGLADLETKRVLPLKSTELSAPEYTVRGVAVFSLECLADMRAPARLQVRGERYIDNCHPFSFEAGKLTVYGYDARATYELFYHKRISRVTDSTPHSTVLDLPLELAEALPYFIKADVFRVDEPGEANDARNWYEAAVAQYAESMAYGVQNTVDTVYGGYCDEI